MLPTRGYFKDIDCPYHERTCGRPYCHFRHRKKAQEIEDKSTSSSVPTYKPTPKSELASNKSHIPISYVPDIVRTSGRSSYNVKDRPTYKPTPKSVLLKTISNAEPTSYTPTPIQDLQHATQSSNLDLDELSQEFHMIDEIITDSNSNQQQPPGFIKASCPNNEEKLNVADSCSTKKLESSSKKDLKHSYDGKDKSKQHGKDEKQKNVKDKEKTSRSKHHKSSRETKSKHSSHSSEGKKSKPRSEERKSKDHRSKSSSSRGKSDCQKEYSRHSSSKAKDDTNKSKLETLIKPKSSFDLKNDIFNEDYTDDDEDEAAINTMQIADECLKIFNEYKAPEVKNLIKNVETVKSDTDTEESYPTGKKRIAYSNAAAIKEETVSRPAMKQISSVGLIMQNRIRIAQQAHAANEGQNLMKELKSIKRPAVNSVPSETKTKKTRTNGSQRPTTAAVPPVSTSSSLIDDIISGRTSSSKSKKIAPVTNVLSIQKAKAKIDEIKNRANAMAASKTAAQTISKGAQRSAHIPDMSLSNIPDVLHAERSKLPVNVRTRYLGLLADECVKLYVSSKDAYSRALNEEFKCYERCSAVITYRNSAMLAVNRLRKEVQERDSSGLGPLQAGESNQREYVNLLEGKRFYDQVMAFMLSEEELILHGFPREGPMPGRAVINNNKPVTSEHLDPNQRLCCRCHKLYYINREGFPLVKEECCYHPLRKRTIRGERTYLCCKSSEDTGCVISDTHVSEISADRELEGFQSTLESEYEDDPRNFAVYALDCEMCYTTKGLELTRVTVVDSKLKTIYESLVKPFNPIIDYNTRFSGITQEHMDKTTTNILQIQANILHLCSAKTILIGHSLESDMKALKIIHNSIVDTSVMFPHKFGLPHKRALRSLASDYLKKIIQNDVGGHDSAEDALAAMELVLWKVKEDLKVKGIKN